MGVLNDLKKLFFASSSIAKSATEKTGDYLKEHGDDILDKGMDLAEGLGDKVLDTAKGLKDSVLDKSQDLVEGGSDFAGSVTKSVSENELLQGLKDKALDLGDKAAEIGGSAMDKFGEMSEKVGDQILDKGGDLSEKVGTKVLDAKDKLVEKAGEVSEKMKVKIDETVVKAEQWEAEQKEKYEAGFPKEDFDASGSFLEGKDDFFSKADKFADGDYDAVNEGKVTLSTDDNYIAEKTQQIKAAGFEDLDNDGDEIIDDAILDDASSE